MKTRILYAFILMFYICAPAKAAKASGKPFASVQPDGTTIMVRLLGDEHKNWYQTLDGVLLVRKDKAYYIAEATNDGQLISTGMLAHNLDSRGEAEQLKAEQQNRQLFFMEDKGQNAPMKKASGYPLSHYCPHMGKIKIPVILMEYPDLKFSLPKEELLKKMNEFFNSDEVNPLSFENESYLKGYGSARQYFIEASQGQFAPEFDFYGPYTAANNHDVYGNTHGLSASIQLKNEAIKAADDDIDFTRYCSKGNGNVDLVYVVYAGFGANTGDHDDAVWPHCTGCNYTADRMSIKLMGISNELADDPSKENGTIRSGIGVFVHEMSHGLGMPDLYWTKDDAPTDSHGLPDYNNCGPELWDIMDGGENIFNGLWPVQYTAWEKEAMGWLELKELNQPENVTLYPFDDPEGRGTACVIKNPGDTDEYYVIENFMCSHNSWNYFYWRYYLELNPNEPGLIVFHVKGTSGQATNMSPNNTYKKPKITILPADGFILAEYSIGKTCWYQGQKQMISLNMFYEDAKGDPYPGSQNVTEIRKYGNYSDFHDIGERYPITDITVNSDRSISFKFMGGVEDGIFEIEADKTCDAFYTIDGRYAGKDKTSLPHGIYVSKGRKIRI